MNRFVRALAAPLLALFCLVAQAQALQPPEIAARSYLLVDVTANQVLASREADVPVEPASLTKLMTAYLVFDALKAKTQPLDTLHGGTLLNQNLDFIDHLNRIVYPEGSLPFGSLVRVTNTANGRSVVVRINDRGPFTPKLIIDLSEAAAERLGMRHAGRAQVALHKQAR